MINPDAKSLIEFPMKGFSTEPPATLSLSDEQLANIITQPLNIQLPLTTVSVERAVSDTTRASQLVTEGNVKARDGLMALTRDARSKRPR